MGGGGTFQQKNVFAISPGDILREMTNDPGWELAVTEVQLRNGGA